MEGQYNLCMDQQEVTLEAKKEIIFLLKHENEMSNRTIWISSNCLDQKFKYLFLLFNAEEVDNV